MTAGVSGALPQRVVCCGTGDQALALARRGYRVTAADFCLPMLSRARRKYARRPGGVPAGLAGDALRLPFADRRFDGVDLVPDDDGRPFEQVPPVAPDLLSKDAQILFRIGRGRVDQVDQHAAPFDVPEKLEAETLPLARPFDQTRNIRHHQGVELVRWRTDHSEMGLDGRERIVGNLRPGA